MKKYVAVMTVVLALYFPSSANAQTTAPVPTADAAAAPTTAPAPAPVAAERPRAASKWRVEFDESAKSDGVITFRAWPATGEAVDIDVPVRKGQTENAIARSTRDVFRAKAGKAYHVEIDDGEDVLVKAKGKTGAFGLQLVGSTVKDVDINVERD